MKLTNKEMEIMAILWSNKEPMTTTEIIDSSENRTWKEGSIFGIMKTLVEKGAVVQDKNKPTGTTHARTYKTEISSEEYAVLWLEKLERELGQFCKPGIRLDLNAVIEGVNKMRKER
ncbi:MAG: BlaI/MecI/CopY family transcriptional regulator [Defluviitaleaceae bacterium]|nr:BlaI/MecI/CopY family transcriptional regulator [Defluviitaleaceae bacterium]